MTDDIQIEVRIGAKFGDQVETFGIMIDPHASRQVIRHTIRILGDELFDRIQLVRPRKA